MFAEYGGLEYFGVLRGEVWKMNGCEGRFWVVLRAFCGVDVGLVVGEVSGRCGGFYLVFLSGVFFI